MFRIDKDDNSIKPLKARSFSELGFKERQHLQEWIAKYPSCLGEDLLIIQKEFAGFSDTQAASGLGQVPPRREAGLYPAPLGGPADLSP